ncbi:MAG: DMT family transporter [Candidatus Diapherotrites archaeon]|nr:DMT family transporter [Candidatus Diapherotrites archaeon]
MNSPQKGTLLVLITALSSGIAIFLNKYALASFSDAVLFTLLKNAAVAVALGALLLGLSQHKTFRNLSRNDWLQLLGIGILGGGIAFAIYFGALQSAQALTAGLLHKTLFLWTAILGVFALREKLDKPFLAAITLLFVGNYLIFQTAFSFGLPEALILLAVLLWSIENFLAKRLMNANPRVNGTHVGFARMFFGAVFLLGLLAASGHAGELATLSLAHFEWIAITAGFLLVYVFTYYNGLQRIPLHHAAALLSLGQPVTAILVLAFAGKTPAPLEAMGLLLIVLATGIISYTLLMRASGARPTTLADLA